MSRLNIIYDKSKSFFPRNERDNQPTKVIIKTEINISKPGIL